jgi:hypothetical protein
MAIDLVDGTRLDLEAEADRVSAEVDDFFSRLLQPPGDSRDRLYSAMRHAAIGGGKRLRPLLTIAAARLFGIDDEKALRVAAASRRSTKPLTKRRRSLPATASTRLPLKSSPTKRRTRTRTCVPTWCWNCRGHRARTEWPAGR